MKEDNKQFEGEFFKVIFKNGIPELGYKETLQMGRKDVPEDISKPKVTTPKPESIEFKRLADKSLEVLKETALEIIRSSTDYSTKQVLAQTKGEIDAGLVDDFSYIPSELLKDIITKGDEQVWEKSPRVAEVPPIIEPSLKFTNEEATLLASIVFDKIIDLKQKKADLTSTESLGWDATFMQTIGVDVEQQCDAIDDTLLILHRLHKNLMLQIK